MENQDVGILGQMIYGIIGFLTESFADYLLPLMSIAFVFGVGLRVLVWYTVHRELWFAKEFSKRMHKFLDEKDDDKLADNSFYVSMKLILELTYYEVFLIRGIKQRRNPDYIMDLSDRVFLIQEGCARLVKESLRQIKHLKYQKERPRFLELTKNVFDNNPCFKKIMGVIPVQATHDVLSILPGIFIIGGIFGTFLGIMGALPELGKMDLENIEQTKKIMDNFLIDIAFSMSTSIVGIIISVIMTFVNTLFDPEKIFIKTVNKFDNSMELLWDCCDNNALPSEIPDFDKHLDPLDGKKLAQDDIERMVSNNRKKVVFGDFASKAKDKFNKDYNVKSSDEELNDLPEHQDEEDNKEAS